MPEIEGQLTNRRLILQIAIAPSAPAQSPPAFPTHFERCNGLLDTGATRSAISTRIVNALNLQAVGRRPVASAKGENMHYLYMIRMGLYGVGGQELPTYPYFLDGAFEVIDWADHPKFDVLIGMDVVSLCDLTITQAGSFRLTLP